MQVRCIWVSYVKGKEIRAQAAEWIEAVYEMYNA